MAIYLCFGLCELHLNWYHRPELNASPLDKADLQIVQWRCESSDLCVPRLV